MCPLFGRRRVIRVRATDDAFGDDPCLGLTSRVGRAWCSLSRRLLCAAEAELPEDPGAVMSRGIARDLMGLPKPLRSAGVVGKQAVLS